MLRKIESCVYYNAEKKITYSIGYSGDSAVITKRDRVNTSEKTVDINYIRNLDIFFNPYDFECWPDTESEDKSYIKLEYNGSFYTTALDIGGNIFAETERYFENYYNGVEPAVILCHSFHGGGPEYEFITEKSGVFTWYSRHISHSAEDVCGGGYDIEYKLYPLRSGTASALIKSGSPIVPPEEKRIIVEVDESFKIVKN